MGVEFKTETFFGNSEFSCTDLHGVLTKYKVNQYDLFELAGGTNGEKDLPFKCTIETESPDFANVNIFSSLHECDRAINFKERFITNLYFKVNKTSQGFGRKVFNTQIEAARRFKFEKITLQATGGGEITDWNGHYTWGRFGFEMILESDMQQFKEFCEKHNREEKNLFELLEASDGRTLWTNEGFTWAGEFYLNEKSSCLRNFQKYCDSKKY